jgi:hypothetical protein
VLVDGGKWERKREKKHGKNSLSRHLRENKMQEFHAVARKTMTEFITHDRGEVQRATFDLEAYADKGTIPHLKKRLMEKTKEYGKAGI